MAQRQKIQQELAFPSEDPGEAPRTDRGRDRTTHGGPSIRTAPFATFPLMEQICDRENLITAWERVRSNAGAAGVDGLTIEQTAEAPTRRTGPGSGTRLAGRDLSTATGPSGGDSETGWRGTPSGHTHRAGSTDPASDSPGPEPAMGPDVLRVELRIPAKPLGASGGRPGAEPSSSKATTGWWTSIWRSSSIA